MALREDLRLVCLVPFKSSIALSLGFVFQNGRFIGRKVFVMGAFLIIALSSPEFDTVKEIL